ncbi:MAG: class I SAM-dependent methyltransferase [Methanomicrobiales archaeon]|jgi:SAM-dependent methyltransferase|nr:class I SAM-dependent methyltransferase [Methanomicrobiales archaeon]
MDRIIDWNELWKLHYAASPERARRDRDPGAAWDRRAGAYGTMTRNTLQVAEQEVGMMDLRPTDTVLDMGAGDGRLAVPMARRVARVTALDPSAGMLRQLETRMAEAGLGNFQTIQARWEDVVVGRDVEIHDVAVAAYSLGFSDLAAALRKLDAAARRAVYLFWRAGAWRSEEDQDLYHAVFGEGGEAAGYPDYLFIANVLHQMGICSNIRIYDADWSVTYSSPEQAAAHWARMHDAPVAATKVIREHFARILQADGDRGFLHPVHRRQAMVWWEKGE